MRRISLITALSVFILSACNEHLIDTGVPVGKGEVVISLDADERVDIISAKSGTETDLPDLDGFWIEIVNSENVKFVREKYADVNGKSISLNSGDFILMAKHGDSLGVGFDKPFYMAKETFTVEPQARAVVSATAKLSNVKVSVNYGEQIKTDYEGFYTVVKHADHKNMALTFTEDESRPGYIPGGGLMVVVYAMLEDGLKCYTLKDKEGNPAVIECNPNDYITFNVNTAINYGDMIFNVMIDDGTELVEKSFEVPADVAASDMKPTIVMSNFDQQGCCYLTEGIKEEADNMGFTFKAYAGLEECILSIDCDYLASLGIPSEIDFTSLSEEELAELEDLGFFWAEHGGVGVVDFSAFLPGISESSIYEGRNTLVGSFTLTVKDKNGDKATSQAKIMLRDIVAYIDYYDYNVWSTKIIDPVLTLENGNPEHVDVEFSMDGMEWFPLVDDVTSASFNMGTYEDLMSGTTYTLRAIYRDEYVISAHVPITTETQAQVANSGFEDFQCVDFLYTPAAGSQRAEPWYLPWKAGETDIWWDVNSKRTLRKSPTVAYQNYKCYPTVTYIVDGVYKGGKSAQIASVATGQAASEIASGTSYPGELFIGRSNDQHQDDWDYASTGHTFTSRPSALKFWYQYESCDNEKFYVKIEVRNAAGNVIASAEKSDGSAASGWTECTMNLTYSDLKSKAASIFMTFRSSTESSPSVDKRKLAYYNSDDEKHYVGSVLRVDEVQLVY